MASRVKRGLTVVLLLLAFVAGALAQAQWVNVDSKTHDQLAYLAQARMLAETHFEAPTNRIEMPAFPTVLSLFYEPGLDGEAWFWRAKLVSIGVALLCAIAMALTLRRILQTESAQLATIAIVFFVFMFRAAYVQSEPLYYLLSFWALLAIDELWRSPTFPRAVLAGALLGAAWLAKASILVAGLVVLPLFLGREAITCAGKHLFVKLLGRISMAGTAALAFALVIAPYARKTHESHHRWLYNLATVHVMWCDSWEDFVDRMQRLGPVDDWSKLADQSQVPTMSNYLASHSVGQIAWRTLSGSALVVGNLLMSPFGLFVAAMVIVVLMLWRAKVLSRMPWRDPMSGVWFVVYFVAHGALQGFYGPIGAGARFSVALAIPAFVFLVRALDRHASESVWPSARRLLTRATWALLFTAVPIAAVTLYCGG